MQEKRFYFLVEISLICENVMSVMSEGLTSAASESTMRLISGSVTATRELSAIKGCDLSTGIYGKLQLLGFSCLCRAYPCLYPISVHAHCPGHPA